MIRTLLRDEKPFLALLGANGTLAYVHKFFVTHQPELTAFLTVLQIIIAIMTILHFARKYVQYLIASAEKARVAIHDAEEKAKTVLHDAAEAAKAKLSQEKEQKQ